MAKNILNEGSVSAFEYIDQFCLLLHKNLIKVFLRYISATYLIIIDTFKSLTHQ